MKQVKWFERKFNFAVDQNIMPSIIERLDGTPIRLEFKLKSIPSKILTTRIKDTWTIKENAGHLIDLEPLWQGRLEDIKNGHQELRAADLLNTKTSTANHNQAALEDLINGFKQIRQQTIKQLKELSEEEIFKSALHPRLKTPMRTIDLFIFVAEHDDHHLARITEIINLLK
jgi:uncharacterized damage-inducible protein DinB